MKSLFLVAAAALALAAPASAHDGAHHADHQKVIAAAVADAGRPAAEKERDAARKPAELLTLLDAGPGDKVGDFIMGGGYFTRLLAKVVGDKGKVYAYQPAEFIGFRAAYGEEQKTVAAAYANVVPLSPSLGAVAFPEPLDAIVTIQNWHDLHLAQASPALGASIARKLYDALKPGGVFLVVDHSATAGSGFTLSDKLHRADPAAVRAEIESAGFKLEGEYPLLRNPDDPLTANVFDPAIRSKTDKFVYKFRKPK